MAVTSAFDPTILFTDYVKNNVEYALQRLQDDDARTPPLTDQELALQALSYSLNLSSSWPLTRRLLLTLAPKMEQGGRRREWLVYLQEGLRHSQETGDTAAEAELRFHLGLLYQLLSQYDEAQQQYERALILFRERDDRSGQARTLNRMASLARHQRRFQTATQLVDEAQSLLDPDDPELAYCYLVRGSLCHDRREWSEAAMHFRTSLSLYEHSDAKREIAWGHANLGMALRHLGNMEASKHHLQRAISLFEEINDPVNMAISMMNLGNLYIACDQPEEALECYRSAEPIFRQTQDTIHQAMICNNLGLAYRHLHRWSEAITSYIRSVTLWREVNNPVRLENALLGLAIAYLAQEEQQGARKVLKEAESLLDDIEDPESQTFFRDQVMEYLQETKTRLP